MVYASDAAGRAWQWTNNLLFRPFDAAVWLSLGFAAWLNSLGRGGLPVSPGKFHRFPPDVQHIRELIYSPNGWFTKLAEHLAMSLFVVFAAVVLWVLFLWLSSHGRFLFVAGVTTRHFSIRETWRATAGKSLSLFLWRLIFSLCAILGFGFLVGMAAAGIPLLAMGTDSPSPLLVISLVGTWLIGLSLFLLLVLTIAMFLDDFVVPLMYKFDLTAGKAWEYFLQLLRLHWTEFLAYATLKSLLLIGAGFVVIFLAVMTCCLVALPYIGAVILLPVSTYFRTFSLAFLGSFHPDFRFDTADCAS